MVTPKVNEIWAVKLNHTAQIYWEVKILYVKIIKCELSLVTYKSLNTKKQFTKEKSLKSFLGIFYRHYPPEESIQKPKKHYKKAYIPTISNRKIDL